MTATPSRWTRLLAWLQGEPDESRVRWRLFWVGFLVRLAYMTLAHTYRMRAVLDHFEYGWEMGRIARALATGYGYADPFMGHSGPTAWTPPLYPLIIAGVFKVFGVYTLKSSWVILAINCVFSAAVAPALYEIAGRCFGRNAEDIKIALWSGWLWALYPAAMQYAVKWIWEMSLTVFLFTWVLVLALRVRGIGETQPPESTQTAARWTAFGILWGLIALCNSSLLTFLPACGLWMIWRVVRIPRLRLSAIRNTALAAICCIAIMCPWVVRNWFAFHAFVPMRTNFGAELYESALPSNGGLPWMATLPLAEADRSFRRYARIGELEYSRQQGVRARALIRAHPGLFVEHILLRIDLFWSSVPHPIEKNALTEVIREANFAIFSVTGLLGLALALKRRVPGAWLFVWAFAFAPLIYYAITVQARFRHPLEPLICMLTVYLFRSADRSRTWSSQRAVPCPDAA